MTKINWNFDVKSLIVGFLLAVVAGFVFNAIPSRAANENAIAADENGVYILRDGSIKYIEKQKCKTSGGCHFHSQ